MLNVLTTYTCGNFSGFEVDGILINLIHIAVLIIQIVVPVMLIIFGMIDLAKAVASQDDKVQKEAGAKFVKRVAFAILVFLMVAIVRTIFSIVGRQLQSDGTAESNVSGCISCFISGTDSGNCVVASK